MKRILTLVFLTAVLGLPNLCKGQNAEQIIKKHIIAIGGLKKINSQQTLHTTGQVESLFMGNIKIEMWMLNNKAFRSDLIKNDTTRSNVMYDHYRWTESNPGKKGKPQKVDDAAWAKIDLDLAGEIVEYQKKGNTAEYIGKENVEGKECFKIKLTAKTGRITYYFIDTKTYLIVQSTVVHMENGKEVDDGTSRMDDYRKTNAGTLQPFLLMQVKNGKVLSTTRISTIEVNKPVDDKVFEMPVNE